MMCTVCMCCSNASQCWYYCVTPFSTMVTCCSYKCCRTNPCSTSPCRHANQERQDALTHEITSLEQDRGLLKQYRDLDSVVDTRTGPGAQPERARSASHFSQTSSSCAFASSVAFVMLLGNCTTSIFSNQFWIRPCSHDYMQYTCQLLSCQHGIAQHNACFAEACSVARQIFPLPGGACIQFNIKSQTDHHCKRIHRFVKLIVPSSWW